MSQVSKLWEHIKEADSTSASIRKLRKAEMNKDAQLRKARDDLSVIHDRLDALEKSAPTIHTRLVDGLESRELFGSVVQAARGSIRKLEYDLPDLKPPQLAARGWRLLEAPGWSLLEAQGRSLFEAPRQPPQPYG